MLKMQFRVTLSRVPLLTDGIDFSVDEFVGEDEKDLISLIPFDIT